MRLNSYKVGELLPIVGKGVKGVLALKKLRDGIEAYRLKRLAETISSGAADEDTEERLLQLQSERPERVFAIIETYLNDDESSKDWAYFGLLDAFAKAEIDDEEEIRFLKCVRELTESELNKAIEFARDYLAYRESNKVHQLRQHHPNVIHGLTRWGFWNEFDGGPADDLFRLYEILTASKVSNADA